MLLVRVTGHVVTVVKTVSVVVPSVADEYPLGPTGLVPVVVNEVGSAVLFVL